MARLVSRVVPALALAALATAASADEHVRGVIKSIAGDEVTVSTSDGRPRKLKIGDQTKVSAATKADLGAITKDAFVGTTAVEAKDGTLRAVEVHVFPEAMRGTGEGHRPWDLKAGSTMTNATVSGMDAAKGGGASTMTNAKVSDVAGAGGGKKLTLTYAGGEKTVVVPPGTPVVRLEPADRAALAPGQHVFAIGDAQPDGAVTVSRMIVGKGGVVPPM